MIHTVKFRIYPDSIQECKLLEIFTIYNRVRRIGYNLLFYGEEYVTDRFGEDKTIQQCLMNLCHNNPCINTILLDNRMRLEQQKTWLEKRRRRMTQQIRTITDKIKEIKEKDKRDRRLKGLYARRSSIMAKLNNLHLEPVVFGGKKIIQRQNARQNKQRRVQDKTRFFLQLCGKETKGSEKPEHHVFVR